MSVLCIGQVGWDITKIGGIAHKNYGGSVLHFSLGCKLMGGDVDIAAYVNTSDWESLLELLKKVGIGIDKIIDHKNTICFNMEYDEKLTFLNDKFSMDIDLNEPDISVVLDDSKNYKIINLCETTPEQDNLMLQKVLKNGNFEISMQYHIDNLIRAKDLYYNMLSQIDYLFLNADEALYLTACTDIQSAILEIQKLCKKVAFVTSHKTNYAISKARIFSVNTIAIEEVRDPTGAGDCFAGGAIASLLYSDDLLRALRYGMICSYFKLKDYSSNFLLKMMKHEVISIG